MVSHVGTSYTYDRNGNLAAYGANRLSYDAADKTTGGTVNGSALSFGYDGLGRRAARTVGTSTTRYWYDLTGMALETGAEQATYLRDPGGTLLSAVTSTGFHNYATDRLGSVTATTGPTGDLATTYRYQPFGGLLSGTGTGRNPYGYTGTYLDDATDLYQMGARYYQTIGRFTQADPLGSSVFTANRYAYAGANPVNNTDPTGLATFSDCVSWSFGLFGFYNSGSACYGFATNGDLGVSYTEGVGGTSAAGTWGPGIGEGWSNAEAWNDQRSWAGSGGGSAPFGGFGAGADGWVSTAPSGYQTYGGSYNIGLSGDLTYPRLPGEVHSQATYTWLNSFNLFDWFGGD